MVCSYIWAMAVQGFPPPIKSCDVPPQCPLLSAARLTCKSHWPCPAPLCVVPSSSPTSSQGDLSLAPTSESVTDRHMIVTYLPKTHDCDLPTTDTWLWPTYHRQTHDCYLPTTDRHMIVTYLPQTHDCDLPTTDTWLWPTYHRHMIVTYLP